MRDLTTEKEDHHQAILRGGVVIVPRIVLDVGVTHVSEIHIDSLVISLSTLLQGEPLLPRGTWEFVGGLQLGSGSLLSSVPRAVQ